MRAGVPVTRLEGFLRERLGDGDVPLLWRPGPPRARRLALALDPPDLGDARDSGPDAVFLHRPFSLPADAWPSVAVLASHTGFDAHLTTGANQDLARALGLEELEPVEYDGRRAGLIGTLRDPVSWATWLDRVTGEFGAVEAARANGARTVRRAAIASSLTPAIVRSVAAAGVATLLTGQLRVAALAPAEAAGLGLVAVGHRRAELWGLRRLAREIRDSFPELDVLVVAA